MSDNARAGFVGIGNMGGPMAGHLVAAGHALMVRDVGPVAVDRLTAVGATAAPSVAAMADGAEIIFVCMPTLDAFRAVALGSDGVAAGSACRILVNLGTTGPTVSRQVAEALAERSIVLVDSPITGGPAGARAGTLAVMLSGPPEARAEVEPLIQTFAKAVVHAGDAPGLAQSLKLVNNLIGITAQAISAEAFVFGGKAGLDPETMLELVNAGMGRNSATADIFPAHVMTRNFDFGASLDIIKKDMDLGVKEAEALGVPVWVANSVRQLFYHAAAEGSGSDDTTTLVQRLEDWAGYTLPKTR